MSSESRRPEPAHRPAYRPPTASIATLKRRAELLDRTRRFFAEREILEVETPFLADGVIVDAHIDPMPVRYSGDGSRSHPGRARRLFLHTSPEAFMKRLLVAGSGPIYQIARVFRDG